MINHSVLLFLIHSFVLVRVESTSVSAGVLSCEKSRLTIDLSDTGLQRIGKKFVSSSLIASLHLEDNQIWSISAEVFEDLQNLEYLNLAGNWLPHSKLTYNFPKLKTLVLDNAFTPTSLEMLNATFTHHCSPCLDKEEQKQSDYFAFPLVIEGKMPELKALHLQNNKITSLTGLENTPNITHLYLGGNEISNKFFSQSIPPALTHLHLENNSIEWFHNFTGIIQLEELILDYNSICRLCSGLTCHQQEYKTYEREARIDLSGATKLKRLSISDNMLMAIDENAFSELESLEFLNLSSNILEDLPLDVFGNLSQLQILLLSNNLLTEIPDIDDMENLRILMLNGNNIKSITPASFSNLPKLHTLSFSRNLLSQIDAGSFDALTSLNELDLSGNKLLMLPENWITPVNPLQRLHLDMNSFTEIESMSLYNMSEIEYLSISGNPLKILSMEALMKLPETMIINVEKSAEKKETVEEKCDCENIICDNRKFKIYDRESLETAQ